MGGMGRMGSSAGSNLSCERVLDPMALSVCECHEFVSRDATGISIKRGIYEEFRFACLGYTHPHVAERDGVIELWSSASGSDDLRALRQAPGGLSHLPV